MWPDRVSNPGPLTYESGAPPIALRGPAQSLLIGNQDDNQERSEGEQTNSPYDNVSCLFHCVLYNNR